MILKTAHQEKSYLILTFSCLPDPGIHGARGVLKSKYLNR